MLLAREMLSAAPSDATIKEYSAYELNAKPCTACGICERESRCGFRDLDGFFADFENATHFLVASPVYNGSMPSPLKAIFDRFQLYYSLRFVWNERPPVKTPKRAGLAVTSGCAQSKGFDAIKKQIECQFTVMNTSLVAETCFRSTDTLSPTLEALNAAREQGRILFQR